MATTMRIVGTDQDWASSAAVAVAATQVPSIVLSSDTMAGWLLPIRSDHCLSYYCNNCSVLIYGAPVLHPPVLHPPLALLYYCSNTAKKALIRVFLFSLLLFPSCSSFFFSIFLTDLCSSVRARFVGETRHESEESEREWHFLTGFWSRACFHSAFSFYFLLSLSEDTVVLAKNLSLCLRFDLLLLFSFSFLVLDFSPVVWFRFQIFFKHRWCKSESRRRRRSRPQHLPLFPLSLLFLLLILPYHFLSFPYSRSTL